MEGFESLPIVLSTIGTVDQPGYWPPQYILGFEMLVLIVLILIVWKVLMVAKGRME